MNGEMDSAKGCATPFDARDGNFFRFGAQGECGKAARNGQFRGLPPRGGTKNVIVLPGVRLETKKIAKKSAICCASALHLFPKGV
ncbi:hypothetical protein VJ923_11350 [Adlercreutzia sp. R25]|uniref:hypothetical protein n=1 Tax=Adlercreutzia shanghongiae TaxID=3111773 RepID=UPI002DBE324A|nr:hypothetical protein [Adlercreutzia sp. R25]MEC4273752.1 hypothetical protein [Adlercreutzia sp. R25]